MDPQSEFPHHTNSENFSSQGREDSDRFSLLWYHDIRNMMDKIQDIRNIMGKMHMYTIFTVQVVSPYIHIYSTVYMDE
jgi:hypothetical protein